MVWRFLQCAWALGCAGNGEIRTRRYWDLRFEAEAEETRPDAELIEEYHDRLKEEAPYAYKDITPVVQTVEDAAEAQPGAGAPVQAQTGGERWGSDLEWPEEWRKGPSSPRSS